MSARRSLLLPLLASAGVLVAACDDDSGSGTVTAPTNLVYVSTDDTYETCETVSNTATLTGGPATFSVAPALPAGLSLDAATGEISGQPTAVTADTQYTVSATNALGSAMAMLDIEVVDAPDPSGLTYAQNNPTYSVNTPIVPNTPTVTGQISSWSISPALPAGLSFSTMTGVISGTPTVTSPATSYTVTAANCEGQDTMASLTITVDMGGGPGPGDQPRFVYVANSGDGTVSTLAFDDSDGRARHFGYTVVGGNPSALELSATSSYLYVADSANGQIGAYAVDTTDGELTEIGASPFSTGAGSSPNDLLRNDAGTVLYAANAGTNTVAAFTLAGDGSLTALAGSPFAVGGSGPVAVALSPAGDFLFVANESSDQVSVFDVAGDGTLSNEQLFTVGDEPVDLDLATSPSGVLGLYVGLGAGQALESYSVSGTGALTALTGSPLAIGGPVGLVDAVEFANGTDEVIYVGNQGADRIQRHGILPAGAASVSVDDTWIGVDPVALAIVPDEDFGVAVFQGETAISNVTVDGNDFGAAVTLEPTDRLRVRSTPTDVVIATGSATGAFTTEAVYATNFSLGDVSQFSFDEAGPSLTALAPATESAGTNPDVIAVHPRLARAYVADSTNPDAILVFGVAAGNQLSGPPTSVDVPGGGSILDVQVDPSGRFLYAVRSDTTSEVLLYPIDAVGDLGAPTGVNAGDVARGASIDPTGKFLYVCNQIDGDVQGYTIDPATGALTSIGTTAVGVGPYDSTFDPAGRFLYVANRGADTISSFSVDATTGALSVLNTTPVNIGASSGPTFLAVNRTGRLLYIAAETGSKLSYLAINVEEGNATADGQLLAFVVDFALGGTPRTLALDASGDTLFVTLSSTGEVVTLSLDGAGAPTLVDTDTAGGATGSTRGLAVRDTLL